MKGYQDTTATAAGHGGRRPHKMVLPAPTLASQSLSAFEERLRVLTQIFFCTLWACLNKPKKLLKFSVMILAQDASTSLNLMTEMPWEHFMKLFFWDTCKHTPPRPAAPLIWCLATWPSRPAQLHGQPLRCPVSVSRSHLPPPRCQFEALPALVWCLLSLNILRQQIFTAFHTHRCNQACLRCTRSHTQACAGEGVSRLEDVCEIVS